MLPMIMHLSERMSIICLVSGYTSGHVFFTVYFQYFCQLCKVSSGSECVCVNETHCYFQHTTFVLSALHRRIMEEVLSSENKYIEVLEHVCSVGVTC